MEQNDLKATELDKMTCSYNLQMLKAALTYFPPQQKRLLSILVKMQELKNTFRLISSPDGMNSLSICSTPEDAPKQGFFDIWNELRNYGSPEQKKVFDRLNQVIQLSSMYEQMTQAAPKESNFPESPSFQAEDILQKVYAPMEAPQAEPIQMKRVVAETQQMQTQQPSDKKTQIKEELSSDLTAASLSSPSGNQSTNKNTDFRTYIRDSLSPENKILFDSYSAMFHSSGTISGKETTTHE